MSLKCPIDQMISIYSAYYGIQPYTQTYCTKTSNRKSPSICFQSNSYDTIKSQCHGKNSCKIGATQFFFTEPCNGFKNKQLFVQYQCVNSSILNQMNACTPNQNVDSICPSLSKPSQKQDEFCSLSSFSIQCKLTEYINIICASYGIDPNNRPCALNSAYNGAPTACDSYDTLLQLKLACDGNPSCDANSISVTNFACLSSYALSLIVQWECLANWPITTTTTTTTTDSNSLNYCSSNKYIPIDTCPSQSVIVPSFLNDSSITNFDYPIYQQVSCYGSKIDLICQPNTIIHVYSAYYGIQSQTSTECVTTNYGNLNPITIEAPALCYSPLTFSQIQIFCETKSSCSLISSSTGLNVVDICPAFQLRQQLFIQYQCVDTSLYNATVGQCNPSKSIPAICPSITGSTNIKEGTWCDNYLGMGSIMSINCNSALISIQCAFYGLHPSISTCNIQLPNSPVCYLASTFTKLDALCSGKNVCSLSDFNTLLTNNDPCGGLDKTLYVQWKCI
jgi:hypothetical protein